MSVFYLANNIIDALITFFKGTGFYDFFNPIMKEGVLLPFGNVIMIFINEDLIGVDAFSSGILNVLYGVYHCL